MQPYQHFTLYERESLQEKLNQGKSLRQIGREMCRSASSISREVKRNGNKNGSYTPHRGTCLYIWRRKRCRRKHRLSDERAYSFVMNCLDKYWSPEIISQMWKKSNPDKPLCHSTIYRSIKQKILPGYTPKTHLIRRGKRKYGNRSKFQAIQPEHTIHERPEAANNRIRIGDWEGDLLMGKNQKSALVTFIDRKSRMLKAKRVFGKSAEAVEEAIVDLLNHLPVRSITLDRGSEFANFRSFQKKLKTTIYFADPHSPWQRGSNENLNGFLRFFFQKGSDFSKVSDDELNEVVSILNDRPRKCLAWLSPNDIFFSKCCT